ncbi:MAG: hypothetical protein ACK4NF_00855 [Planctomycetota bacterium]
MISKIETCSLNYSADLKGCRDLSGLLSRFYEFARTYLKTAGFIIREKVLPLYINKYNAIFTDDKQKIDAIVVLSLYNVVLIRDKFKQMVLDRYKSKKSCSLPKCI